MAQTEFENLYQEKVGTETATEMPLVSEARNKLIRSLSAMNKYIDYNAHINVDPFPLVADKLNQVIADSMALARTQKTRQTNGTETPAPQPQPVSQQQAQVVAVSPA